MTAKRAALLAVLAAAAAVLAISGCDWFEEQSTENLPPATELVTCPGSEVEEGEDMLFRWVGTDIDGVVVGYEWSLNEAPWIETEDDSVVVEAVGEGEHSFVVRAIDDKGDADPVPPECNFVAVAVGELVDRIVMVEMFTTYTCGNCPKAEEALNNLMEIMGKSGLCVVGYHDWRGGDPASDLLGTEETVGRIQWYTDDPSFPGRAGWWPTVVFDGLRIVEGAETVEGAQANYATEIQMREEVGSPVRLSLTADLGGDEGSVQMGIKATGRLPEGPLRARCVVIEDHVYQRGFYFDFVARRVLEERALAIAEIGDSTSAEWTFPIDDSWNMGKVDVVVFVQNDAGREILQSRRLLEE
jgi:hypothetical protein